MKQTLRNKQILDLYITNNYSLEAIGKMFEPNLTRERVRQIVQQEAPGYKKPKKLQPTPEDREARREENRNRRNQIRLEQFWSQTKRDENTGCIEWMGTKINEYGKYSLKGLVKTSANFVHRISYILHFGEIPEGMLVLHRCDNGICVNPDHLYLGTPADNVKDREERFQGIPATQRDKTRVPKRKVLMNF